jgi:glycosyltransferase involved in cell wall biosynthesis
MRIMVLGLRGFPGIQGGVETHAEQLYPRLRALGCDVEVIVRSPYWENRPAEDAAGIRFTPVWSPKATGAEAFVHSFLGVLHAARRRPDVLHIHAIGPAIVAPLAKLFGLRVVVTHHGPDYDREKWSPTAKAVLRTGERFGMLFSDARIVISGVIRSLVKRKYNRDAFCIPNGVEIPADNADVDTPASFGLNPGRYVVNVSRMVPEKRHLDLIDAFAKADLPGWKLALVGDLRADDSYIRKVKDAAARCPNVVLTGFQSGKALSELYANAGLFVLPSTHEGLPIALLEALSYGLPSIASDIPANVEVNLPKHQYFEVGNVDDLSECLIRAATQSRPADFREQLQDWVRSKYDWDPIARSTLSVYRAACARRLGEILVTNGLLSPKDRDAVLAQHERLGLPFGECCVRLNLISAEDLSQALEMQFA